jgi:hypothetical protein
MKSEIKWLLVLAVAAVAVVAGFLAIPGQHPESMTAGGGQSPPPPADPGAGHVGAGELAYLPATVKAPYSVRKVAPATATNPVSAEGWAFEFPWPPLASKPGHSGRGTVLVSASGVTVAVHELLKAVDWDTQYLDAGDDARDWLIGLEKQSVYSFYETVLSTTEQAAPNLSTERFKLAAAIKDALLPPSTTAIHAFALNALRGFQIGEPTSKRVTLLILEAKGTGVALDLTAKPESAFTQADVDAIIGTMKKL